MGWEAEGDLEDLYPENLAERAGFQITDALGTRFRDRVAMRTPVSRLPEAYKGNFGAWIKDRGGRTPRTLRDSWRRTAVQRSTHLVSAHFVDVFTEDEIASHVEWDTEPHRIRAKMRIDPRSGELRQGALRFPSGPVFRYAVEVWHPGTTGVHMMRDTQAELEAELIKEVGERELEKVFEEVEAGR